MALRRAVGGRSRLGTAYFLAALALGLAALGLAALGLAALGLAAFLGVLGFLAAGFLAAFLAGDLAFLAAGFLAAFLGVFGFLAAFLGDFAFFAAGFLAAGFLATFLGFSTLPSLKDPAAPVPLVWTSLPAATADFRYRLMKGASLATSTFLLLAAMYFLMAAREDPFLSLRAPMASLTMVATGGWVGATLGFLALTTFLTTVLAGVAAAASDMLLVVVDVW